MPEFKIGIWQIMELAFMAYVLYQAWTKNGNLVWDKNSQADFKKQNIDFKVFKFSLGILAVLMCAFWFFVAWMGGCRGIWYGVYVVFSLVVISYQISMPEETVRNWKQSFNRNLYLQTAYQIILFNGGFYTV